MNGRVDAHPTELHPSAAVDVTLVTAEGCHYCDDAAVLLEQLGERYPLRVRTIRLTDREGAAIARRFRVPFPPVLLVDGSYFGHGRISRRKLTEHLTRIKTGGIQP